MLSSIRAVFNVLKSLNPFPLESSLCYVKLLTTVFSNQATGDHSKSPNSSPYSTIFTHTIYFCWTSTHTRQKIIINAIKQMGLYVGSNLEVAEHLLPAAVGEPASG